MRYFLHLAYLGTNYSGWQRQTNAVGIQQVIEESISKVLKEKVFIHGCGRTDAGVHASQYFAHVDFEREFDFNFIERINLVLPYDISIYDLIPMNDHNHAQYDVTARTYTYHLHTKKIPHKSFTSSYYNTPDLNLLKIGEAIKILKATKDFRSLCKHPDLYKHTLCKLHQVEFKQYSEYEYALIIKADRFLRGMIRFIIARLIDIGTGKLSIEEFSTTLSTKADFGFKFIKQGYPQGLFLSKIEYPYMTKDVVQAL